MMHKKAPQQTNFNLGILLLGICLFSYPVHGAELTKPLVTTSSWLSQLTSWGFQAVKNTAATIATIATPFIVSKSANALSDTLVPTKPLVKKRTFTGECAHLAAHTLLLGGSYTLLKKAIPYLTGDAEKPFIYYATLAPMLYFGARAAYAAKNYWGRITTNFLTQGDEFSPRDIYDRWTDCSWSEAGKLAGATALLLGSYWIGSHMPLLVQSFFFDSPVPYVSLTHVLSFLGMNEVYSTFFNKTRRTILSISEDPMKTQNPYVKENMSRFGTKVA